MLEFRILGPLEVVSEGEPLSLGIAAAVTAVIFALALYHRVRAVRLRAA